MTGERRSPLWLGVPVAAISAFLISQPGNVGVRALTMQFTAGDMLRFSSWREAIAVISEDPLIGSAYHTYGAEASIHNGFLLGWATFGLPWVILFLFAVVVTVRFLWNIPRTPFGRVASFAWLGIVAVNTLFHTLAPGLNDMAFMATLGLMSALNGVQAK